MQTDQDIAYINNNCHRLAPLSPFFPYILYRNKDVHTHNAKMLSLTAGEQIMLTEIDNYEMLDRAILPLIKQFHCHQ